MRVIKEAVAAYTMIKYGRTRELVKQRKALAAIVVLAEDPGLILSTTW